MDEKKVFDVVVSASADEDPLFGFVIIGSDEVAANVRMDYESKGYVVSMATTEYNTYLLTDPAKLEGYRVYVVPEKMKML